MAAAAVARWAPPTASDADAMVSLNRTPKAKKAKARKAPASAGSIAPSLPRDTNGPKPASAVMPAPPPRSPSEKDPGASGEPRRRANPGAPSPPAPVQRVATARGVLDFGPSETGRSRTEAVDLTRVHERCPVCDWVFKGPQGIPGHYKKHIAADVSADAAKAALDAFTAHVVKKSEDKRRAAVEEKRRREAARQASARQAALELRRRREAEGVTERSQQPRVEHDREVAGDGLEAFPTYDYPETQWDGVATGLYQRHMDDIAKSLREDGVLVLNTAGWRRGYPFNPGSRRVSGELQTALGALNAEDRFPHLPECVRLEGKKHVTWPRNVAKANVAVRDYRVDHGIARAMDALDTVARDTLHNVCRSLGFRSTELDALLDESPLPLEEKGASTLTVFAYDAARDALPSLTEFAAEPHVDRTILTLVVSNQRDGLRVRRADDSWRTASLGRYRIAVIPGHTLEHALGGAISATTHAVSRLRVPRNALVFRLAARRDAVVSPATPRDIAARYPTQTAKELDEAFERTHRSVNRPPEPANPARRAARATPAIGRKISLTVRDQDNYKLHIKTRLDCEFLRIFDVFRDDRGLAHDAVRFLFDGSRINPVQTPRDLDMEDGDCIEAMMEQVGD